MGFMDKVKATMQEGIDTVSKTIDNEKVDSKMREEKRKADKSFQEIGQIVVRCMMSGEEFDVSMVSAQYSSAVASMQAITDYNSERTEPSTHYDDYLITDNYVMPQNDATPTPEPAPAPEPEPEPEPRAVAQPEEAPKIEAPENTKKDDYSDWVEITDDKFWEEEKPAEPTENIQSEEPAEQTKEPEPAAQQQSDEGSSMLSRMQSYKSSNYNGENFHKK